MQNNVSENTGIKAGKESRTYNMTAESWSRRYKRISLSTKFFCCIFSILIVICMIVCCNCRLYSFVMPFTIFCAVVMSIPLAYMLEHVYVTREILDVDGDAMRYDSVLEEAEKNVNFFQRGWVKTERVRAKIAMNDIHEAKILLNSYDMRLGMTKYYILRQLELRGICAILENDSVQLEECENDLERVYKEQSKCSCFYNSRAEVNKVKEHWALTWETMRPA